MAEPTTALTRAALRQRLTDLYASGGPFTTVTVDVSRDTEDAAKAVELRWRGVLDRLREAGAPDADVAALEARAGEGTDVAGAVRRTVVVADGEVLLDEQVPGGPGAEDHAVHGLLPDVVGLVAAAGSWVPYVAVEASRVEASVALRVAGRAGGEEHHVAGEDFHARKVRVGGWRHDHFQNHAEEVWRGNAEQVAAEVVRLVRRSGARLVVVAGDVRAREALEQELAGETRAEVVGVDVNALAEGSSDDQVEETLADALSDHQRRRLDTVLDRLAAGLHPESAGGRTAVEGVPAVVEALQQAQVEVLLLHPGALGDQRLAVLAEAPWVAQGTGEQPVESLGEAAAADALLRAASLTDAEVLVLEDPHPQLAAGAAAVLRWAAPSG